MRSIPRRSRWAAGLVILLMALAVSRVSVVQAQDHGELVALLKENVFRIKVFDADGKHTGNGSGFYLRPEGLFDPAVHSTLAVTNHHVVRSAASARAVRLEDGKEFPISLMRVASGFDQALIRVELDEADTRPRGLAILGSLPLEGTNVWAVGYPGSLGFTMTRGVISGVRKWENLKAATRARYDKTCVWLQIDAALNSGNSGGPVVDADGRLLGVSTWSYIDGEALNFASSATHIIELVSKAPTDPIGFSPEPPLAPESRRPDTLPVDPQPPRSPPITPAPITGRPPVRPTTPIPPLTPPRTPDAMPDLSALSLTDLPRDKSVSDLLARARSLKASLSCTGCAGVGTIQERRKVGERRSGSLVYPIMTTVTKTCVVCSGRRIGTFEKSENALIQFTELVGAVERRDDDAPRLVLTAEAVYEALLATEKLHPAMNGQSISSLTRSSAEEHEPTYFTAKILARESVSIDGRAETVTVLLVNITSHDRQVLLVDPLWSNGRVGSTAMVFGPCVGQHADGDRHYPVVQGSLIVAY